MGWFSDIVDFVADVVNSIVTAIADLVHGIFSNPLVFALCIFVAAFLIFGGPMLMTMLQNPVWALVEHPILSGMLMGAFTSAVGYFCPELGRVMGYTFGIISFCMTGFTLYSLWSTGTFNGPAVFANVFGTYLPDLTAEQIASIYVAINVTNWTAFVGSLAEGVNPDGSLKSAMAAGMVDGYFAIPNAAAAVLDAITAPVQNALSGLLWLLVGGGLLYLASSGKARPVINVEKGQTDGGTNS